MQEEEKGLRNSFSLSLALSPSGVVEVSVSAFVVHSECALAPGAFFCLRENSLQPVTQHSHHQLDHYHSRSLSRSSSLPPVQPTLRCLPPPPLPLVLPPPTPDVDGYYIQLHTHTHSLLGRQTWCSLAALSAGNGRRCCVDRIVVAVRPHTYCNCKGSSN